MKTPRNENRRPGATGAAASTEEASSFKSDLKTNVAILPCASRVVSPIPGTRRWRDGECIGMWGDARNPVIAHVVERDGSVRQMSRQERRAFNRAAARHGWATV